jgi:hypothetical protein
MRLKKYLLLICLLVLLPATGLAESEITGWARAKWGMSQAEVNKIYELNSWEAGSSPTCKMKQKIKIMGRDFAVAFYFDQRSAAGKLYRVVLAHFNNDITDVLWLKSVKEMLVEKYGLPDEFDISGKMKASRWIQSGSRLKLTTLTGKTVMCAIDYLSLGSESKKL